VGFASRKPHSASSHIRPKKKTPIDAVPKTPAVLAT